MCRLASGSGSPGLTRIRITATAITIPTMGLFIHIGTARAIIGTTVIERFTRGLGHTRDIGTGDKAPRNCFRTGGFEARQFYFCGEVAGTAEELDGEES